VYSLTCLPAISDCLYAAACCLLKNSTRWRSAHEAHATHLLLPMLLLVTCCLITIPVSGISYRCVHAVTSFIQPSTCVQEYNRQCYMQASRASTAM
jgi:hypothetical protein